MSEPEETSDAGDREETPDAPEGPTPAAAERALPRLSLLAVCLPTAALLAYGAWVLPWQRMTAFSLASAVLAALHLAVAVLAVVRARQLRVVLRLLGLGSLLYLAWIAQQVLASGLYVAEIYGSLGKGVAAGMGALVGLVALLTLPLGIWALALTAPRQRPRSLLAWLLGGTAVFGIATAATWASGRADVIPHPADARAEVKGAQPDWASLPYPAGAGDLFTRDPVSCPAPPSSDAATAVVTYRDREGPLRSVCLQAAPGALAPHIREHLSTHASRSPIKLDWITSKLTLQPHPGLLGPLVDILGLRPGLDGACHGTRCLMPWQLLVNGVFAAREPSPYIPKMRLGFAVSEVRRALGMGGAGGDVSGIERITTESLLMGGPGGVSRMVRMRPREVRIDAATLAAAERAAEQHVLRAQRSDGTYRYQLDAYGGDTVEENPSIPRHAGTTLVLCELGSGGVSNAVQRALVAQAGYARPIGDMSALVYRQVQPTAGLGDSALGLVAFTACRKRVGARHDALIGRLARFLISLQREDGSFRPGYDRREGRKLDGPTPMFAGGQAIMALAQLEEILRALPPHARTAFPPLEQVSEVVERAMDYVATDYWPSPLREFFFLKENWHCLAARAALRSHRHDGYERFCIDYVEFKSRLLLGPRDGVDEELVGGYGFGNVVPPHNGSSGGLGEALGAAIALRDARGEDASWQRLRLRRVLGFLLRQQLRREWCFACLSPESHGWFSGFMVAPGGRIDHIQHPWSALGHGARVLQPDPQRG